MYVGRIKGKQQLKDMESEPEKERTRKACALRNVEECYNRYKDGGSPTLDSWHLKNDYIVVMLRWLWKVGTQRFR